ncbi:hypothetical protein QJS83_05920 [Bdellovibrio sp. 22V]|uniref:hypothetical protein n=1 Tax=Bdellovibrio TaxID=958 RepID=UPI002542A9B2|nr:hypothetical protein [Bdellovibrio sp. 22V]WII73405.1 hypothetical protein QJS83_05920 [Bdellovibrio sp. 22V]
MGILSGWKNKGGTANRSCAKCGSWRDHWQKKALVVWPIYCAVQGCTSRAMLGAHVHNKEISGERIIPMCHECNTKDENVIFSIKPGTQYPSANQCT